MLWWLVDNANTLIVVLGLVALALAAGWWNTRRRNVGIATLVTLGLILLVYVLSLVVVTDRKQLVANLHNLVDAVGADKIDDAMNYFADEVKVTALGQHFTGSRKQLGELARSKLAQTGLKRFVIWNVDVEKVERPNARVTFYLRPESESAIFMGQMDLILVGDRDWRIKQLRVDAPGQGKDR